MLKPILLVSLLIRKIGDIPVGMLFIVVRFGVPVLVSLIRPFEDVDAFPVGAVYVEIIEVDLFPIYLCAVGIKSGTKLA